jgi:hypothetical protein
MHVMQTSLHHQNHEMNRLLTFDFIFALYALCCSWHTLHACFVQACVAYAAATFERFQQVVNTPGFLHLNQAHPQVGAMFVQMALEYMGVKD